MAPAWPHILQWAVAGLDSAMVLSQPVALGGHRTQPAAEHAGGRAATCPSQGPQLPRAGYLGCKLPRQFPAAMPRLSSTLQPRGVRDWHGASLQHSTCPTLSLHPPGSLIKRSAAACLPGAAKSNHVTRVHLEMLSSSEARRGQCASP